MEKRRKRPSYIIPIIFFLLELILMWLTLSLFNWDLDISKWHIYAYPVVLIWVTISAVKLNIVLKRQHLFNE